MPARPIILDANILLRFVLGEKVPALLTAHAATIDFLYFTDPDPGSAGH